MNTTVTTYLVYLALSVGVCVWVAQTLYRNGRVFLINVFGSDEALADSVNHLLVVGFYLVNLGFIALWLKVAEEATSVKMAIESVSYKVGFVLLVLGAMHFLNLVVFSRIRAASRNTRNLRKRSPERLAVQ